MDAIGSPGFPVPRPFANLGRLPPTLRIAAGFLQAVLVDLTRPVAGGFTVLIFDEGFTPAAADVVAAFVLYGGEVAGVGRGLEHAWGRLGLRSIGVVRYVGYRSYDHPCAFAAVLQTVEGLQASFLP